MPSLTRITTRLFALSLFVASFAQAAEPVAKQFLRYLYGEDGIELASICHPSDDAWMLRGAKNPSALAELKELKIPERKTGVTSGLVGADLYFIETRDGRVDPAFNLDGIYGLHRQLIFRFLFAVLAEDQTIVGQLVTDEAKVTVERPKAPRGEMVDRYGAILEMMPMIRSSQPADDAKSRTITYRVPFGEELLSLTLIKEGSTWKIETSKKLHIRLDFSSFE